MSNCPLFTASLLSTPSATLVILLPPLSKPVLVRLTGVPPFAGVIVIPLPLITVLLFPSTNCALVKFFNSFASFTFNVSVPSAMTPILPSTSLLSSVSPPLILMVSPNLRFTFVPASPAKVNGLSFRLFNCLTLTASLSSVPSATPPIFASEPSALLTFKPSAVGVKFTALLPSTNLTPLNSGFSAIFTVSEPVASAST